MTEDVNVHKEHRRRSLNSYRKNGGKSFEKHQLLEMLMYFSVPQCDTNPTAHRLISKFPANGMLTASSDDFQSVYGVGEKSASLLGLSRDFFLRTLLDTVTSSPLDTEFSKKLFLFLWFSSKGSSVVAAAFLDGKDRLIDIAELSSGKMFRAENYLPLILNKAEINGAKKVILCHNHRDNSKAFSLEDSVLTEFIESGIEENGLIFEGSYIVTNNDCIKYDKQEK